MKVREATERHDAVFVSSIRTYGNLGPFRPLDRAGFKGIRIFDMLLRPHQVVCGSSVRAGDPDNSLYGNWGIIIGSGTIQQAFPYDAASYVVDGQAVSPYNWRNTDRGVEDQVADAIECRNGHNEIDIALGKASIAGIFFGTKAEGVDGIDLPSDSVLEIITSLSIPYYQLRQGEFYRTHTDGTIEPTPTMPEAIISHGVEVPKECEDTMKSELAHRLYLPPRNAISAGWQVGRSYHLAHRRNETETLIQYVNDERIDRRYFGTMVIYAANLIELEQMAVFDRSTYHQFVSRLRHDGMLQASRDDIEYYLATGNSPEYLGKI